MADNSGRLPVRKAAALISLVVMSLAGASPAHAHGDAEDIEARDLVLTALAYLANEPDDYLDVVTDKVADALEADDTEGVDMTKVEAAQAALDAGDLEAVRENLQAAVLPLTEPVTGDDPGTTVVADPLDGSTDWGGADGILAALSALALVAGVVLAVRWRPEDTVRELRQRLGGGERS